MKIKIPFLYRYDESINYYEDEKEIKRAIKSKIRECNDVITDRFAAFVIVGFFGGIPLIIGIVYEFIKYIDNPFINVNFWAYSEMAITNIAMFSFCIGFLGWCLFVAYNRSLKNRYKRDLVYWSEAETKAIKEEVDEDVFENSIKLSYKYLDEYYAQTREQAKNGFYVTVFVAIFGAFLIAGGVIIMFMGKTEPAYVTCTAGVLTEFISSIFFYLYNKTIMSMRNYHDKLVLSQNVSIALKVADSIEDEEKTRSKVKIIEELLKNINSYLVTNNSTENEK